MNKAEALFAKRYFPDGGYLFWRLAHIDLIATHDLWTPKGEEQRCAISIGVQNNGPPITRIDDIPTHLHFYSSNLVHTATVTWLNEQGRIHRDRKKGPAIQEILRNGDTIDYWFTKGRRLEPPK